MKDSDKLMELLNNPYTEELLRANSDMVNYSVMRIISVCELLEDAVGADADKGCKEYIEMIRAMCRNMLRNSAVNNAMAAGNGDRILIRADRFLEDVAAGCKQVLGDKFKIAIRERSKALVRTDPDLLRFFILGSIRRALKNGSDRMLRTEAGTVREDGSIRLYIRFEGGHEIDPEDDISVKGFFEANYGDICKVISDKLGVIIETGASGISFLIPEAVGGAIEAKMPFVYFDPEDFSFFRIMLGDIDFE